MVTTQDYVKLNEAVYKYKNLLQDNVERYLEPDVIKNLGLEGRWVFALPPVSTDKGFFGAAFLNTLTHEVVVVYRGTDDPILVLADNDPIPEGYQLSENIPELVTPLGKKIVFAKDYEFTNKDFAIGVRPSAVDDAERLYLSVVDQYKNDPQAKIFLSGHSMGGGLAQLVAGESFDLLRSNGEDIKYMPQEIVTFNPVGTGHINANNELKNRIFNVSDPGTTGLD